MIRMQYEKIMACTAKLWPRTDRMYDRVLRDYTNLCIFQNECVINVCNFVLHAVKLEDKIV